MCAGLKLLSSSKIDRVIHVGSPLTGSGDAFRAAYGSPSLPLMRELSELIHGKNTYQFWQHLQSSIKTFPSLYQLMPNPGQNFLFYSASRRENPFDDRFPSQVAAEYRRVADDLRQTMRTSDLVIARDSIPVITVFTENHSQVPTDTDFRVRDIGEPDPGYEILEIVGETRLGDGTVLAESARGTDATAQPKPLLNIRHDSLCNDKKVADVLATII